MSPEVITVLMILALFISVLSGFPIAFGMGVTALIFGIIGFGSAFLMIMVSRIFGVMSDPILLAIPLFVFMGVMLQYSGATERLFNSLRSVMGSLNGGLAIVTVMISTLFAACTGIIGASVVIMSLVALPPMIKLGYNKQLATGAIAAGGSLGTLIPPSIMLILYGPTAGISIAALFAAAILPGLLLSSLYVAYIGIRCFLQPDLGPPASEEERNILLTRKLFMILTSMVPPLFLILAVLGTILFGIAAPTEAAAMGAAGSILITVGYHRKFDWKIMKEVAIRSLEITAMVMWVIIGASLFTGAFLALGGGDVVRNVLLGMPGGPIGILIAAHVMIFLLGKFIDWIGIVLIMIPILAPITVELGFDPIWFAITICMNLQMSYLTPPFAYAIFYIKGAAPPEVTLSHIYQGVWPFIGLQATGVILVIIFPQIALWLPGLLY